MQFWQSAGSDPAVYDAAAGRWWSREDMQCEIDRLADCLPGSKALVFCFCRNDMASLLWYLGSLRAGHAVALLDANLAPELRDSLVAHYDPDCVADGANPLLRRRKPTPGAIHPSLALLLSTSGSTGSPKFVRLTSASVHSNALSIQQALSIGASDCAITSLPMHYSYGLSVINSHLLSSGRFVLTNDGLMTPAFWSVFRQQQCTSLAGVPYSYQMLRRLKLDNLAVPSLRTLTQAGGKLQNELIAEFHAMITARGGRFYVMYGQTEATARISILPSEALPAKLGSAGLAIPGGQLRVDDGELVYHGPNVMMGYATTRQDLALGDTLAGTLRTGDSAYLDDDGYLFVTGRRKRDAKLFGLRLNLDEIETILRAHGPTAVIASDSGLRIFCEHGDEAVFARMRTELSSLLKVHHQAFHFERIPQLPLNANGKIDYPALAGQGQPQ